jgi:thiaminase
MKRYHEQLLHESKEIWTSILKHPFLLKTANGTIDTETFKTWIRQDYIFVRDAIPFMAVLLAKGPLDLRSHFIQIMVGLDKELELFRSNAQKHGVDLTNIKPSPTCQAYIQFLMNTAYNASFEEGFTVLYAAEKVYLDSWMVVKKGMKGSSPWQEFIDNWTSEGFQQYVDWLATTLDELVREQGETKLRLYGNIFQQTARYEFLFWDMAAKKEVWPV